MKKTQQLGSRIILIIGIIFAVILVLNIVMMVKNSSSSVEFVVKERTVEVAENIVKFIDVEKLEQTQIVDALNEVVHQLDGHAKQVVSEMQKFRI